MPTNIATQLLADNPIVISGTGVVSAGGNSPESLWDAVLTGQGTSGWREFEISGERQRFAVSPVTDLDSSDPVLQRVRRRDRCVQLGLPAAIQALQQAHLFNEPEARQAGLVVGSSRGPVGRLDEAFRRVDISRYPPTYSADCTFGSLSGALALALNIQGPGCTLSATCASSAYAMAQAAEHILLGKTDIMLVGGTEAPLHRATIAQLHAAGVLGYHDDPRRTCRPFDVTRNGLALGEGAAFIVLETARSAEKRGIQPLAKLSGWNTCMDQAGRAGVSKTGTGMVAAAQGALDVAGLNESEIDHVNTHGTGTRLNDLAESRALFTLFGERTATLPCVSTKAVTGHCLGATPALEAVICIEALRKQKIPPSTNCFQQDPLCPVRLINDEARSSHLRHVMTNSLGFWGYHASLIFSKLNN